MTVVTPTILSDGSPVSDALGVIAIDVTKEVNRVPGAMLLLLEGIVASGGFPTSDSTEFEPGKEIEIKLRYEGGDDTTVFKGVVTKHSLQSGAQGSVLRVEMKDKAIGLTACRRSAIFREVKDSDVISDKVDEAGLEAGEIATRELTHPELVQYYATDWDFIVARAQALGSLVVADDGKLSVFDIDLAGAAEVEYDPAAIDIYDFELELDARSQRAGFESQGWNLDDQALEAPSAAADFSLEQSNLTGAQLADAMGFGAAALVHPVPLDPAELTEWANARMIQARMSMVRGRISVPGNAEIKPMSIVGLAGMGARFNGKALVTGVKHQFDDRGWRTDLQLGLAADLLTQQTDVADSPAAGLLPPARGLQIGVIDAFEEDPDEQLRVRVKLPRIGDDDAHVWARLTTPDAGAERGFFFRPETGDEVVVGFFNDDPRQAVVLGSMYGAANAAPEAFAEVTEDNVDKGIVTRAGSKIHFIDGDTASIHIETPSANKVLLDEEEEEIRVEDQHGNSIVMNADGITITSAADFKLEASGNVEITGSEVEVK